MDVVNKIVQGDTTHSITIVRAGAEAEKFIVNDESFKGLADKQWRKVKYYSGQKSSREEKFIADNYPGLTSLPDGLRYKVLVSGKSGSPGDGSSLIVKYSPAEDS